MLAKNLFPHQLFHKKTRPHFPSPKTPRSNFPNSKTPHSNFSNPQTPSPKIPAQPAFTIIEMTLSLTFISVLLITLAMLITHISSIYQKGMAIRSVNANGRELIDDFTRSLNAAPAKSTDLLCRDKFNTDSTAYNRCRDDQGYKFYYTVTTSTIQLSPTRSATLPIHGAICTGRYSYLWNSGYVLNGKAGANKNFRIGGSSYNFSDARLLKIRDDHMEVCGSRITSSYGSVTDNNDYAFPSDYTTDSFIYEMLPRSEDNLALYDLRLFLPAEHRTTQHTFNSATFILATVNGGIDITASGDFCTDAPDNLNTDFNYCAINKFNFATRSSGDLTTSEQYENTYQTIQLNSRLRN